MWINSFQSVPFVERLMLVDKQQAINNIGVDEDQRNEMLTFSGYLLNERARYAQHEGNFAHS
jgi:hypothetical protein